MASTHYGRYENRSELSKILPAGLYYINDEFGVYLSEFYFNESAQVWVDYFVQDEVESGTYSNEQEGYEDMEFLRDSGQIMFEEFEVEPFYVEVYEEGDEAVVMQLTQGEDNLNPRTIGVDLPSLDLGVVAFKDYQTARKYLEKHQQIFADYVNYGDFETYCAEWQVFDSISDELLAKGEIVEG